MSRVHEKTCPSCGAPLPVPEDAASVKCAYCGTTVHVETPRSERAAPPGVPVVTVTPGLPKVAIFGIVLSAIVPMSIGLVTAFGSSVSSAVKSAVVQFPVECGNNEELRIANTTYSGPGPLVRASMNCKLTIVDSKLSSDVVVQAGLNDDITIQNSTLDATDVAVRFQTNGSLHASRGSVLLGRSAAIAGGVNTKVELEDARVEGGEVGISGDVNTEIHATRTTIRGHDAGIATRTNGHVFGDGLGVTADLDGIQGDSSLEVSLERSTIEAGEVAIHAGGNLHGRLLKKSRVTGKAAAVDAADNLDLVLDDSAAESDDTGARTRSNPHVKVAHGGTLRGARVALDAGENLELTVDHGSVESAGTAVCGKHNAQIEGRGGSIAGGAALRFERAPEQRLEGTSVTGASLFDGKGCAAPIERVPAHRATAGQPGSSGPGHAPTPTSGSAPVAPPFDAAAAVIALDAATRAASAQCRAPAGKAEQLWIAPGFSPDGRNAGAAVSGTGRGTAEAACVEQIFRGVRIPPFDPATRPSGLVRAVALH